MRRAHASARVYIGNRPVDMRHYWTLREILIRWLVRNRP